MRFMVLVRADKNTEAGVMPDEKLLTDMGNYNQALVDAGVLQAGEGLHPSSNATRVRFSGGRQSVINGPFDTRELIAGFWIFQVKSKEEALEWVKRCPAPSSGEAFELEIRQIFEATDFGDAMTPELKEQEDRQRETITRNAAKGGK